MVYNDSTNLIKTELTIKEVSNIIDETPHIIRNWLKELKDYIPVHKNEAGYNVFDDEALERIKLIKQLHRNQNYSIKQIQHYFATGGESYKPTPSKGTDELLAEEMKTMREEIQELRDLTGKQTNLIKDLVTRMDQQQRYIDEKLTKRDELLLETLRESQETKRLLIEAQTVAQEAKQVEEKKPRKGILKWFSKE